MVEDREHLVHPQSDSNNILEQTGVPNVPRTLSGPSLHL